jgi:hypothetical protein
MLPCRGSGSLSYRVLPALLETPCYLLSYLLSALPTTNRAVYIAPLEALAKERLADWTKKFGVGLGVSVVELTGEGPVDAKLLVGARGAA